MTQATPAPHFQGDGTSWALHLQGEPCLAWELGQQASGEIPATPRSNASGTSFIRVWDRRCIGPWKLVRCARPVGFLDPGGPASSPVSCIVLAGHDEAGADAWREWRSPGAQTTPVTKA